MVESIEADRVVLRLVRGLLPDGSDRVTLMVGQSMTLTDGLLGRTYTIKLLEVRSADVAAPPGRSVDRRPALRRAGARCPARR